MMSIFKFTFEKEAKWILALSLTPLVVGLIFVAVIAISRVWR